MLMIEEENVRKREDLLTIHGEAGIPGFNIWCFQSSIAKNLGPLGDEVLAVPNTLDDRCLTHQDEVTMSLHNTGNH